MVGLTGRAVVNICNRFITPGCLGDKARNLFHVFLKSYGLAIFINFIRICATVHTRRPNLHDGIINIIRRQATRKYNRYPTLPNQLRRHPPIAYLPGDADKSRKRVAWDPAFPVRQ
jgi:hypothetical protein